MTFEDFDYVDIDYDDNTFTIIKEGHSYTYDIDQESELYSRVMGSDVEKYEVYSQEESFEVEETGKSASEYIQELWNRITGR